MRHVHLAAGKYFGHTRAQSEFCGVIFSVCEYGPHTRLSVHTHQNPYGIFALAGQQDEIFDGRRRIYQRSLVAFHPAGEAHAQQVGKEGFRCFHFEFGSSWRRNHPETMQILDRSGEFLAGPIPWFVSQLLRETRSADPFSGLAIEGLLLEMTSEAARLRVPNANRPWLREAEALLREEFDQSVSLREIARRVGVHPTHLAREFRKQHGCTLGGFVRRLRVEKARDLIARGKPLAEVASEAGFADQSHMTRTFISRLGISPAQFRRGLCS